MVSPASFVMVIVSFDMPAPILPGFASRVVPSVLIRPAVFRIDQRHVRIRHSPPRPNVAKSWAERVAKHPTFKFSRVGPHRYKSPGARVYHYPRRAEATRRGDPGVRFG